MHWENTLNAFTVADAPHGKCLIQSVSTAANHDTRKNLNALFIAFNDFRMHANAVANAEIRSVLPELLRLNLIQQCLVHKFSYKRSGLRSFVRCSDCSARHFAICAWLPESNTSGT